MSSGLLIMMIGVLILNTTLLVYVVYRLVLIKSILREVGVFYFTEAKETNGIIKNKKSIVLKAQLVIMNLPFGHPVIISEQSVEAIDQEKIKLWVEGFVKPLMAVGIKVSTQQPLL